MDWLTFGQAADGLLVHVDEIPPTGADLLCPYCTDQLVVACGVFTHTSEPCAAMTRDRRHLPILPLIDRCDDNLTPPQLAALANLGNGAGLSTTFRTFLSERGYVQWNGRRGADERWSLTPQGAAVAGTLPLKEFCALQGPLLRNAYGTHQVLAEWAVNNQQSLATMQAFGLDLRLYRAAWRRWLLLEFGLLALELDGRTVYHSAVSYQPIAELADELHAYLDTRYRRVAVTVLGAWPHHGTIARYFAHRYRHRRMPIEGLAECFDFDDHHLAAALRDLEQMPPAELTPFETRMMLFDEPLAVEVQIGEILAAAEGDQHMTLRAAI